MTDSSKRPLSSDESNYSDDEKEDFKKFSKISKRKKPNDELSCEKSTLVSPEKIADKNKGGWEFKTPEKIPFKHQSSQDETTPMKERMQAADAGSPSGWSLSSNLSVCIDGDEDDLMSKVEQARRLMSSSNSSPDRGNRTPKKNSVSSPSSKLSSSPKTPNKTRRVELITIASPKSKKT